MLGLEANVEGFASYERNKAGKTVEYYNHKPIHPICTPFNTKYDPHEKIAEVICR
jgi:hypothetical protein